MSTWTSPQKDQLMYIVSYNYIYINPSIPFPSVPGFSLSCSLNCWSSEAQGVSREFVRLWQGRDVFPQRSLKSARLSTPGLSAGPLSLGSSTAGSTVRLACIPIWSHTHMHSPTLTHSTCDTFSTHIHTYTCIHTQRMRRRRVRKHMHVKKTRTCIHKSCTQEDICKKDVVTFGWVGKEIIGMMEIWAQAYAHTLADTRIHTH